MTNTNKSESGAIKLGGAAATLVASTGGAVTGYIVEGRQTRSEPWVRMWLGMTEPVPFSNRDDADDFAWNQRRDYEDAGEALETRIVEVSL